jgi:hypothetical protein
MSAFDGLKFDSNRAAPQGRVTTAIATASRRTGVDFNYLLSQARVESSMNPNARASTSSASGLYRFRIWNGLGRERDPENLVRRLLRGRPGREAADP